MLLHVGWIFQTFPLLSTIPSLRLYSTFLSLYSILCCLSDLLKIIFIASAEQVVRENQVMPLHSSLPKTQRSVHICNIHPHSPTCFPFSSLQMNSLMYCFKRSNRYLQNYEGMLSSRVVTEVTSQVFIHFSFYLNIFLFYFSSAKMAAISCCIAHKEVFLTKSYRSDHKMEYNTPFKNGFRQSTDKQGLQIFWFFFCLISLLQLLSIPTQRGRSGYGGGFPTTSLKDNQELVSILKDTFHLEFLAKEFDKV